MVHHITLFKLKPEVTPARIEEMMMNTRMQLLKISEVLSIKCGKRIDPELPWPFFIAIDFESMDKYAISREDSIFVKFMEEVIDRKSTRLNSSHVSISYAVFCLKKKTRQWQACEFLPFSSSCLGD